MNQLNFWIVLGVAAVIALFVSRGKVAFIVGLLGVVLVGLGGGSVWLIEKGPQKVFLSRSKVLTPSNVAEVSPWCAMAGIGLFAGALVRGASTAVRGSSKSKKGSAPKAEANTDAEADSNPA